MNYTDIIEIKPGIGIGKLIFGATLKETTFVFGEPDDCEVLDDIKDYTATLWHYHQLGITLFFDHNENKTFTSVEVDNKTAQLWTHSIFTFSENSIIDLFKKRGIIQYEIENEEWGEKRLSFDTENIDFYFEKNTLLSVNYGKSYYAQGQLIFSNN